MSGKVAGSELQKAGRWVSVSRTLHMFQRSGASISVDVEVLNWTIAKSGGHPQHAF